MKKPYCVCSETAITYEGTDGQQAYSSVLKIQENGMKPYLYIGRTIVWQGGQPMDDLKEHLGLIYHPVTRDDIAKMMKALRKKKGLTQVQLAEKSMVAQATIAQIENGKRCFGMDLIMTLINACEGKLMIE